MNFQTLRVEQRDHVAWVTLNRPERLNALSTELTMELTNLVNALSEDPDIRVIVLRGAGRAFGAGADLKEQHARRTEPGFRQLLMGRMRAVQASINSSPKIVIAAVHGFALAGSLELMMACDLAIATQDARLSDQHANFGLPPVGSATQRLPRLVGTRRALEMLLTGISITGTEAAAMGLVNRAVPADRFDEAVEEFARSIATKSPLVTAMIKELVYTGMQADFDTGMTLEKWAGYASGAWDDVREGITAFNEKREPDYKGR